MKASSFILLLLFALAATAVALEPPPPPNQWVTDAAGLLSPSDSGALNQKLAAFEQETGAQFIVYTIPSLEGDPVEDFTIRAVEKWKVGQAKYDNGLVLFVFPKERKVRIETGYGLEGTITDAFASRVIREIITPRFAQGDWSGGLTAGADALMAQIRTGEAPVEPMRRSTPDGQKPASFSSVLFMIIIFALLFFVLPAMSRGRGRRRGGCNGCILPLLFMPGGGGGITFGGHRGGFGGGGFGGFSGGGGGFGGGGATGGW